MYPMEYLSKEKFKELEEELVYLKTQRRKEIAESLEFAKSLGDLSENAEYIQAREDQAKVEERIMLLDQILKTAVVITKHHSNQVEVGSTIVVEKAGSGTTHKYQIVGSEEADMKSGKISNRSPLGQALFGKKKGEKVTFNTPSGTINYTVVDIE